jgi:hypothetical protein
MMRKPDFLIIGAPKCGTTAMAHYLASHPEIGMAQPTKPHFFGRDLKVPRACHTEAEYLSLFPSNARLWGEATPYYLYSETAAQDIYEFNPAMKLIIMLRNPVDLVYSLHCQRVSNSINSETILTLRDAIAAEGDRALGHRLPPAYPDPKMTLYTKIATFYPQVQRYLKLFPADQMHIILYDDLTSDVGAVYQQVLAFLGATSMQPDRLPVINANRTWRCRGLQQVLETPPQGLKTTLHRVGITGKTVYPLYRWLTRANQKVVARSPLDPALAAQLRNRFRPDLDQMSQLLGRSLLHWVED